MSFDLFLTYARNLLAILAVFGVTVEVIPIKISPLKWIGCRLNAGLDSQLKDINSRVSTLEKAAEKRDIEEKRAKILQFANSCRQGRRHTIEEFEFYIKMIDDYHNYIKANNIENGVIDVQSEYIKKLYLKLLTNEECPSKVKSGGLLHYVNNEYKDEE